MFTLRQKIEIMRKYEPNPFGTYLEFKSYIYRSRIKVTLVIIAAASLLIYLLTL